MRKGSNRVDRRVNDQRPAISVIIPTHNRVLLLRRAVESVLGQTYRNFELVIVDDASTDDTAELVHAIGDERVRYLRHETRQGGSAARNAGIRAATGDWVAFLDSDDWWDRSKLHRQLLVAQETEASVVYCDLWRVDKKHRLHESGKVLVTGERLLGNLLTGWTAPNTSTLLAKRAYLTQLGGFDQSLQSCQDHDLWFKIALSGAKVSFVADRLSYFTSEATNRLSLDHSRRLRGVHAFLRKWRPEITRRCGTCHYKRFEQRYLVTTIVPLLRDSIRRMALARVFRYCAMLGTNPFLYEKLLEKTRNLFGRSLTSPEIRH